MKRKTSFKVSGKLTFPEKAYALIRHHAAKIAERVRTKSRCRDCFKHDVRRDGSWGVARGCDGCAEMGSAIGALRELFRAETKD